MFNRTCVGCQGSCPGGDGAIDVKDDTCFGGALSSCLFFFHVTCLAIRSSKHVVIVEHLVCCVHLPLSCLTIWSQVGLHRFVRGWAVYAKPSVFRLFWLLQWHRHGGGCMQRRTLWFVLSLSFAYQVISDCAVLQQSTAQWATMRRCHAQCRVGVAPACCSVRYSLNP